MIERKWRAGYFERGKSGSEGGLCKPTVAAEIYTMLKDYKPER